MSASLTNKEFFASFFLNIIAGLIGGLIVGLLLLKDVALWRRLGALFTLAIILFFIALGLHQKFLKK